MSKFINYTYYKQLYFSTYHIWCTNSLRIA